MIVETELIPVKFIIVGALPSVRPEEALYNCLVTLRTLHKSVNLRNYARISINIAYISDQSEEIKNESVTDLSIEENHFKMQF